MISEARVEAAIETIAVPRHIALVRVTHWIIVLSVVGLLVSGIGILVGHPRLYWGETGSLATPSLIDLPIPFVMVHILMIYLAGFWRTVRAMITGYVPQGGRAR